MSTPKQESSPEPSTPRGLTQERARAWSRFFGSPFATLTTLASLAGLVSLPLALVMFLASRQFPQLRVATAPTRARLVSATRPTALTVSYEGEIIAGNIESLRIVYSNQGTRSIRAADILEPMMISLPEARLLSETVRSQTRPVVNAQVTRRPDDAKVLVSWTILEPSDGFAVEVVYAADRTPQCRVGGLIEGQPDGITLAPPRLNPGYLWQHSRKDLVFGVLTAIGGIGFGVWLVVVALKGRPPAPPALRVVLVLIALASTTLVLGFVMKQLGAARPPFPI